MIADWLKFGPALLLLLLPSGIFHRKKTRFRPIAREWKDQWAQTLTHGLHWIDLTRAMLGASLLLEGLDLRLVETDFINYSGYAIAGGVIVVAACLQTVICREELSMNAPFAFVTGLVLGLFPPLTAALPLLLALTAAGGSNTASAFFPTLGVTLVALGLAFQKTKAVPLLTIGATAVILPWLLSIMFARDLVVTFRAKRLNKNSPPPEPPPR